MADIQPPSFSLGLDLDSSISGPHISDPDPNPNPDPDPLTHPSFSLGLDFEPHNNSTQFEEKEEEEEIGLGFRLLESDPDDRPGPILRRLRRGGPITDEKKKKKKKKAILSDDFVDDDIEEFSSQEYDHTDDLPAPRNNTLCSSSKVPLSGCGILTTQREGEIHNKKRKQDSSFPSTTTREKSMLSDLSASPLRKFQLLDSDSDLDDPSESVHNKKDASVVGSSTQEKRKRSIQDYFQFKVEKKTKSSTPVSEKKDLWKDFYEDKTCDVSTPAFDEFCKEFYSVVKPKQRGSGSVTEYCSNEPVKNVNFTSKMECTNLELSGPPSHRYFYHEDLRIQNLVRSRLPYFCPLDAPGDTSSNPSNQPGIDYMSQFGHGDAARRQTGKHGNAGKSSRRCRKKVNTSNGEGASHASTDWVNPNQIAHIPKDASKRRVHADGQSAGHWFTAENGKKVYVTSNGKELTGRQAYAHYRKESGKGVKRTKKKASKKK